MIKEKTTVWFMSGYSNLYHAINDIKQGDVENKYQILCTHTNKHFVAAEAADFFEVEPNSKAMDLINFCKEMIVKYNVKVIFPSQKQGFLYKYRKQFKKLGANLVTVGNSKIVYQINHKDIFYNKVKPLNVVSVPDFEIFNNKLEFVNSYKKLNKNHNTVCMKPSYGVYGIGFYVLTHNKKQIYDTLAQNQKISVKEFKKQSKNMKFKKMLLMQYLNGVERSVDCVAKDGYLIGGVIRKKNHGNLPQSIENNPLIMSQVTNLVKKLKLNGLFNVQFKDHNGVPYLLEINPRLSGRSFYATLAGLNLTYIASEVFSGNKKEEEVEYSVNYGMAIHAINCPVVVSQNIHTLNELNKKNHLMNTKKYAEKESV